MVPLIRSGTKNELRSGGDMEWGTYKIRTLTFNSICEKKEIRKIEFEICHLIYKVREGGRRGREREREITNLLFVKNEL